VKEVKEEEIVDVKISKSAVGIAEGAQSLSVHPDTLRRAAKSGRLRTIRVARRVLIPASELERVLAEGLGGGNGANK